MNLINSLTVQANTSIKIPVYAKKILIRCSSGTVRIKDWFSDFSTQIPVGVFMEIKIPVVMYYSPAHVTLINPSSEPAYVALYTNTTGGIPNDEKYTELWG